MSWHNTGQYGPKIINEIFEHWLSEECFSFFSKAIIWKIRIYSDRDNLQHRHIFYILKLPVATNLKQLCQYNSITFFCPKTFPLINPLSIFFLLLPSPFAFWLLWSWCKHVCCLVPAVVKGKYSTNHHIPISTELGRIKWLSEAAGRVSSSHQCEQKPCVQETHPHPSKTYCPLFGLLYILSSWLY